MGIPTSLEHIPDDQLEEITDETEAVVQIGDKYYRCHTDLVTTLHNLKRQNDELMKMAQASTHKSNIIRV